MSINTYYYDSSGNDLGTLFSQISAETKITAIANDIDACGNPYIEYLTPITFDSSGGYTTSYTIDKINSPYTYNSINYTLTTFSSGTSSGTYSFTTNTDVSLNFLLISDVED